MLRKIIRVSLFTMAKGANLFLNKFVQWMRVSALLHEILKYIVEVQKQIVAFNLEKV